MNKDDSFWRTQISYYFWHSLVGWIDLFYIVYIKNKLLLPILKKNCIYYYSSDILATPPIYKSLIERDTKATTFLLNNGHDIINESGFVYFNRNIHDYETRIDIIDQLILQKNNTSIRCIYENVSIEHIIKKTIIHSQIWEYYYLFTTTFCHIDLTTIVCLSSFCTG